MKNKIIGIFVMGILLLAGFASIPSQAGPVLQPLTSPDSRIVDMIQQVNESLLNNYLSSLLGFGPRYTETINCTRAAEYIYNSFSSMGLSVNFHTWHYRGVSGKNVVATLNGTDETNTAEYIFCAHYDTFKGSPGAMDNGAGVASVLVTAKILSQYSFPYTIRFIAFSGEEQMLYGSYMYARNASQRGDNIVAVINVDQMGFANTTEGKRTLCFFYPERSKWISDFAVTVNTLYMNQTNITIAAYPHFVKFDHYSFISYGFDGISASEYDHNRTVNHTPFDTIDQINWIYFSKVTKLLLAVIAELASTTLKLQVIITAPYQGYLYFFNIPLFPLDFGRNHLYGLEGTPIIFGLAKLKADVTPNDNIDVIIFCIDDILQNMKNESAPHYEWIIWSWYFHLFGRHSVKVYACTTSGEVASDEMNVFLFTP